MKSDQELINEINEHIKEMDYVGSSLDCGVSVLYWDNNVFIFYYPSQNCLMISYKDEDKIKRDVYSEEQARKIMSKYIK